MGRHGGRPPLPADEDETTFARRVVAQRCLYGVDRNPVAVDLAKMSLWLITLARDHPLTFLDHALRHGNSLVGLTRRQIETFHWKDGAQSLAAIRIGQHIAAVTELRRQIREAGDDAPGWTLQDMWDEVQQELTQVRMFGDLAVAAFFTADNAKARETKRLELADAITTGIADRYRSWLAQLRDSEKPLAPFHWSVEFPEVFDRERPGFDAIVGNPPFLWGNRISRFLGDAYRDWLLAIHARSHGNSDLVAHFLRKSFELLRDGAAFGLVATNSISETDTRATGLEAIVRSGGVIFAAQRDSSWPGSANVRVAKVFVCRGTYRGFCELDGQRVSGITPELRYREFIPRSSCPERARRAELQGRRFRRNRLSHNCRDAGRDSRHCAK